MPELSSVTAERTLFDEDDADGRRNPPEIARAWEAFRAGKDDPTAFARLFSLLLNPVFHRVRRHFPAVVETEAEDAVSQALTFLALNPEKYNPNLSSLLSFLVLVARRRLTDALRKKKNEVASNAFSVADGAFPANTGQTDESRDLPDLRTNTERDALNRVRFAGGDPAQDYPPDIEQWLKAILPDSRDRQLLRMSADGQLSVEEFALLYQAEHLTMQEQQREMKRHRDRVQKRVERQRSGLSALLHEEFDF